MGWSRRSTICSAMPVTTGRARRDSTIRAPEGERLDDPAHPLRGSPVVGPTTRGIIELGTPFPLCSPAFGRVAQDIHHGAQGRFVRFSSPSASCSERCRTRQAWGAGDRACAVAAVGGGGHEGLLPDQTPVTFDGTPGRGPSRGRANELLGAALDEQLGSRAGPRAARAGGARREPWARLLGRVSCAATACTAPMPACVAAADRVAWSATSRPAPRPGVNWRPGASDAHRPPRRVATAAQASLSTAPDPQALAAGQPNNEIGSRFSRMT